MNKKFLAVAVASVLLAPVAAQAQTANVTLYGRLNTSFENVRGNGTSPSTNRVSSNSSRFGLKGEEKLGNGVSAIFQIESSISADAGGGTLAARDTFVGLTGNFGTVRLGNFHSPYDDVGGGYTGNFFYTTGISIHHALWANCSTGAANAAGCFDQRWSNSVRYDTPNLSGFTGKVQYSISNEAPANSQQKGNAWIFAGEYKNGPFGIALGHIRSEGVRTGTTTNQEDQATTLATSVSFGDFWISANYERLKYDIVGGGDLKRDYFGLTGKFKLGQGTIQAHFGQAGKGKGSAATGATVNAVRLGDDTGARMFTVGYDYAFSKRTSAYAYYTKIDNKKNAAYNFAVNAFGTVAPGSDPSGVVFGLKHDF